jgi:hypothetical protein
MNIPSVPDMRIDPDTCRDPDLLAAEVRRLQGVIAAASPTLTDEERDAVEVAVAYLDRRGARNTAVQQTLCGLLRRTDRIGKSPASG